MATKGPPVRARARERVRASHQASGVPGSKQQQGDHTGQFERQPDGLQVILQHGGPVRTEKA